jgi:UDP-N-acetyl-D-glucosamine dehydrogenase
VENTPKVVSGVDETSLKAIEAFYATIVERTVPVSSCKAAELAKLLENTFRHVNIALVNEIAVFAHGLGIDVWEAIDAASSKPFGFMRFTPGPGVGGHCLPIDPSYLSWRVERALGQSFRFVELANDINNHMPDYVVQRLVLSLNKQARAMNGSRVLLLGLAYKKNTGDARESPAARVVTLLADMGAQVRAADPFVVESHGLDPRMTRVELSPEEVSAADAVVVLTDHDMFDLDMVAANARLVLDTRHRMSGPTVEHL